MRNFRTFQIGMGWFPELPGGLDRVYYNLVSELRSQGVDVRGTVVGSADVCRSSDGTVAPFAQVGDSLVVRLAKAARSIRHHIHSFRPDVVASHFALFALPILDVVRETPFVVHFHGPWAQELVAETSKDSWRRALKARAGEAIEKLVYRRACRCIVLSQAFGEILSRDYGVPPDLIRVVPGGVEIDKFAVRSSREEARQELGLEISRPIIVVVRRLARRMGMGGLIDAVAIVRQSFPDILVLIGGRGPLERELRSRIEAQGLSYNVRLLGFVPDEQLHLLYRAAQFSIVPSIALEGFGLITLESLASGTPVLVTPIGGLPEVVSPLSPDLVFASTDPKDMAQGIIEALSGVRRLPTESECQSYVAEGFSWSAVAKKTMGIYQEAMQ
jgi:glycosyltransferase involved in cell wall biosynthesis